MKTDRAALLLLLSSSVVAVALAGCAADKTDTTTAAARSEAASQPSTYLGWRMFQQNCARCHGAEATGTANAPDLLPRVRSMSEARFAGTVLHRYQWVVPAGQAAGTEAAREALVQDVLRRREGATEMPAWEGEPKVRARISDLFAYLEGRASGKVPPGKLPQDITMPSKGM